MHLKLHHYDLIHFSEKYLSFYVILQSGVPLSQFIALLGGKTKTTYDSFQQLGAASSDSEKLKITGGSREYHWILL